MAEVGAYCERGRIILAVDGTRVKLEPEDALLLKEHLTFAYDRFMRHRELSEKEVG